MASSVDAKLLRQTKFPPEFNQKVDVKKVNIEVMKRWIASRISEILGNEDDVVIELCFNLLEGSRYPDIKALQISLTGFLDKDTPKFCKELWNLCLSAQNNPQGVPKELLEAKKLELLQEKVEAEKAADESRRRKDQESNKEREIDTIRQRERAERGRGRGVVGRDGRPFESRLSRDSRSPPPAGQGSLERYPPQRREVDTYVPRATDSRRRSPRRNQRDRYHARSPSRSVSRSPSRSSSDRRPQHRRRRHSKPRYAPRQRGFQRPSSPSVSPPRSRMGRWRGRYNSRGDRSRSDSQSERSRSRSPRRLRIASSSPPPSRSPSPRPRHRRRKRRSPSSSRSSSISQGDDESRVGRRRSSRNFRKPKRSPSYDTLDDRKGSRADVVKDLKNHDGRRLSRSGDRQGQRRHNGRGRTRSPTRSRSRGPRGERKRRRSLERWAPAARKRRNTSSVTSPGDKRRRIADASADEDRACRPPSRDHPSEDVAKDRNREIIEPSTETTTTVPVPLRPVSKATANELREKILREKIKASRKTSKE